MVQSVVPDAVVHGAVPRLVPPGQPGVQSAAVLALGRAILVTRMVAALLYAAAALALSGPDTASLMRYAVPFGIIAVVTLAELLVLPRVSSGPPRVGLVMADSAVAFLVFLLWTADPVYVIYQAGAAALAGALLGLNGTPLWIGQAVQAGATCWVVLSDKIAPVPTTLVLICAPAVIVGAGASAVTLSQLVRDRLNRDLDPAQPVPLIYDRAVHTLRAVSLSWLRLPLPRRQARLADDLARSLTQDTVAALQEATRPVSGVRFDYPGKEFTEALSLLCREWEDATHLSIGTDLPPVWLRVPVRHQLALIVDDALANVADHARATRAQVELAERRQTVTLIIKDNGRGFTVPTDPGTLRGGDYEGICRMISRSAYLGANLTITTAPYSGTEIKVRMSGR
ncbi:sensor histidine kinase [Kineosporia succinea]|uniref:Two-component sensor histidine kinase n=1 Tax=Kineosporia succinea TaxID=84632 RepID=A0ABT9P900_9ACTN|nr:hypothetical protein [Kineosporia succinea]MDP9829176.1 two-component sensor histidine kinase [Kineosporia succinea]